MEGAGGQRGIRPADQDLEELAGKGVLFAPLKAAVYDQDLDDLSALVALAPAVSEPSLSALRCKRCSESFETTWTLAHHQKRCRLVMRKRAEARLRGQGVPLAVVALLRPHLRVPYSPCDFVAPRYYVGGAEAAGERRPADVRAAVLCAAELGPRAAGGRGVPTLFCAARDAPDEHIVGNFAAAAAAFVQQHGEGRVLFACAAGQSRSVALLCATLMMVEHLSLLEALSSIKAAREIAYPNVGFFRQLCQLELALRGVSTVPMSAIEALHADML